MWYACRMDSTLQAYIAGDYCTVAEAALILGGHKGISPKTVHRMIEQGILIAWTANPKGRKKLLYKRQVEAVAANMQSEAIKYSRQMEFTLDY